LPNNDNRDRELEYKAQESIFPANGKQSSDSLQDHTEGSKINHCHIPAGFSFYSGSVVHIEMADNR